MKESDFEQFCEMVPSLVSDISKLMGYRDKVYRNVTEVMDDKMMEKTVIILKDLKMTIRNGSILIKWISFKFIRSQENHFPLVANIGKFIQRFFNFLVKS